MYRFCTQLTHSNSYPEFHEVSEHDKYCMSYKILVVFGNLMKLRVDDVKHQLFERGRYEAPERRI